MSEFERRTSSAPWEGDLTYTCQRCGGKTTGDDINTRGGEIKCIHCGYRILKKEKPPVVKRIAST